MLSARAIQGLPEIAPGADLAGLIWGEDAGLEDGDVIVVAHKAVSKSEGRTVTLADVRPGQRARELAAQLDKDPRHVQVVLDESAEVVRAERGVLICLTHQGFICANAGVDASNAPAEGMLVLLPRDPDGSARALRAGLQDRSGRRVAVIITDSFGRAWRHGQCDVAIGCAGIDPLEDWRGRRDANGRILSATWIAVADQLAATADLARSKDASQPVVVIRGAGHRVRTEDGPGAAALLRPRDEDLFR